MNATTSALQRPETLTNVVARRIRDGIMRGEFAPAQALPEVGLSERFGVSRGTVREACRVLAEQGLIDIFPHRGAFVARLTPRKARELYTVRAELESYAVRLAVERGGYGPEDWAALAAALAELEQAQAGTDNFELAEADMRFHDLLTRASDHQTLLDILGTLRLQMRRFIVYTKLMGSDVEPEGVTHRRLLDAVRSGDAAVAARAVHHHITEAGELLLRKLVEREGNAT